MRSQVGSRKLWSNPHDLSETEAYTPSFVDRFMGLIQRLPGPHLAHIVGAACAATNYLPTPPLCVSLAAQFPWWADLPINRYPLPDWVLLTFRLHQWVYLNRYPEELGLRNHE